MPKGNKIPVVVKYHCGHQTKERTVYIGSHHPSPCSQAAAIVADDERKAGNRSVQIISTT